MNLIYLYGYQMVLHSSHPHHSTLQNGITTEKKNIILFFFHQHNIYDEQKMRTLTTCTEYFIWSIHHFIKIMDIKLFRDS